MERCWGNQAVCEEGQEGEWGSEARGPPGVQVGLVDWKHKRGRRSRSS